MSFILTNLVLWPFLFLVTVPVLLHLFARSRPPVYKFSSVEFILRIVRSSMRIKRPQDWLLLVIRTLLFAAIILLFLQPLFFAQHKLAGLFQRKNVVLIVDATASMGYADGAQTRFAAASAEASEILRGLSGRDSANIIWLDSAPEAVFPEMGSNLSYLHSALRRGRVTCEAGDISAALQLAARMLSEKTAGKHEICVISDFQKTAWEGAEIAVPDGMDLVKLKVGQDSMAENGAVTAVYFDPKRPLINEEVQIYCEVHNYSAKPRRRTVFVKVHERRQSQPIMIPAWSKATALFTHKFTAPGVYPVTISLDEDSFPADDRRWSLLEVREFLRVGILAQEPGTARVWRQVLEALGCVRIETLLPRDLEGELPFDMIMLSGWTGVARKNLRKALAEGCTIVCAPAGGTPASTIAALVNGRPKRPAKDEMRWEQSDKPYKLKVVDEKAEVFRLFASGEYGDPANGVFHGRLNLSPAALPAGRHCRYLLAYDDGVPALVRFKKKGSLFFWNLPLAPEFSNWASQVEFLPFLAEILFTSRGGVGGTRQHSAAATRSCLPGGPVYLRLGRDVLLSDMKLRRQDGRVIAIREQHSVSGGSDVNFVSAQAPDLGLYTWTYEGKPAGYSIVNFPVVESDLRALSLAEISKPGGVAVSRGSKVRQLRDGVKLWPYLLIIAVALALLEGAVLLWTDRT